MSQANDQSQTDQMAEALTEISHLKDKVAHLESRVSDFQQQRIELERYGAIANVRFHSYFAQLALHDAATENKQNNRFVTNANACIRFARDESNKALADIATSSSPKQIAEDWLNQCRTFFTERGGFNVFR